MIVTKKLHFESKGNCDIIDITLLVERQVEEAKINSGIATIFISGSTAGVTTMEYEPGLLADFKMLWERIVPRDIPYEHNHA